MPSGGPSFGRMATVSLLLHVTLIVLVAGTSLVKNRRFITPNPYFVDLVTAPAPKKPAGVPKRETKTKPAPPPRKPAPEKKPEAKKEAPKKVEAPKPALKPGLEPARKTPSRSGPDVAGEINRLRAIDRIRRLQALRSVVDARRGEEIPEEAPPAGGEAENADRAHVYYGVVTHRVWEHWTYAGNPEPDWETLVYIQLDGDGTLLDQRTESSSGNEEFDRSVMRALAKAAPFPPPPEGIDRHIVFRFRP